MCLLVYLGALKAASLIAEALGEADVYDALYIKGRNYLENVLFNGDIFRREDCVAGYLEHLHRLVMNRCGM